MQTPTPRASSRRLQFGALALALALGGAVACGGGGSGPGGKKGRGGGPGGWGGMGAKADEEPLAVELVTASARDIIKSYAASGTLEAIRSAQIRPEQAGVIDRLLVEEGEGVEAGDVLARLDNPDLSLAAKRDRVAAQNARRELERLDELARQRAASEQEVDQQRYAVAAAEANAKLSRLQASQSVVKAPFAGTITARPLDPGNLVTSADVIYELADLETLELALYVPEREAAQVQLGARVALSNLADAQFEGEVIRRAPVVDPLTGTVKFTIHTRGARPETAVPGAFVSAHIELEAHRGVPALPRSAIVRNRDAAFVYVIEAGKAARRSVELGMEDEGFVEILGGLDGDTKVVVDASEITDGMPLKPFGASQAGPETETAEARAEGRRDASKRKRREAG